MEQTARASLMAALPTLNVTLNVDLNIASNTAVDKRTSRALWQAAPPPPNARVSVPNTVAVKVNAGLQNAHLNQSASSSFATNMVVMASAHTHQDAARLHSKQVATARGTLASRK